MKKSFKNVSRLIKFMSMLVALVLVVFNLCSCDIFVSPKQVIESSKESIPAVTETTKAKEPVAQSLEDKIIATETALQEAPSAEVVMDTQVDIQGSVVTETTLSDYIKKAIARPNENAETDYDKNVLMDFIRKNYYEPKVAAGEISGNCFVIIVTDGPNEIFDEYTNFKGEVVRERTWKMYPSPRMANETNIAKNFWFTTMDITMSEGYIVQHKYTRDSDFKSVVIDLEYLATKPDGLIIILPEMFR